MRLIIEQDELQRDDDHRYCCAGGQRCQRDTPYVFGPCLFCNGEYLETAINSFSIRIEEGEELPGCFNLCCGTCARLSFGELRTLMSEQLGPLEFQLDYVEQQINLLDDLPEFDTVYRYLCGQFSTFYRRVEAFNILMACEVLEHRFAAQPSGFVYLLASPDGYCKIGRAKVLDARLKQIGLQLPFRVELIHSIPVVNPIHAERLLHRKFANQRMNGEWFNLSTEDIEWFKGQSAIRETQGV